MEYNAISIRPFVGAKDFEQSRSFYRDLGFTEAVISLKMSLFQNGQIGFYLQDAYVKDWVDNTMIFIEVTDLDVVYRELLSLNLKAKYQDVRLVGIREEEWGRECFLHDPSGILWHFGELR